MKTRTIARDADFSRLESLEPRLLLSVAALGEEPLPGDGLLCSTTTPAVEAESNGGPTNDDLADAQELLFSPLPSSGPVGDVWPEQAAVIGTADGAGGDAWTGTTTIFGSLGYPYSYPMNFANAVLPGGNGVLTITAKADLAGTEKYLALTAEGIDLGNLFVEDGLSGAPVTAEVALTQAQLAALAADDGIISFMVTPSAAVAQVSSIIMAELSYSLGGGSGDFYRMELGAGESVSAAADGGADSQLDLELADAEGNLLAGGVSGYENADVAVSDFVSEAGGAYFLRVAGTGDYCLVVNRNATMDLENNDLLAAANPLAGAQLDGSRWAAGSVSDSAIDPDSDFYSVTASADTLLKVRLSAAAADTLETVINIYDADGNLLVSTTDAQAVYRVPADGEGTYHIEVAAADGTEGDYVLSVREQLLGPKGKGNGPKNPKGQAKKGGADPLSAWLVT